MDNEIIFRTIFDQAAVGLAYIESKTGRLIKVNNKFCDILGIEMGEATKITFMAITHPDDLQEDLDNMQKLLNGELREFSMEKWYLQRNDSIIWGNLTVSALWAKGKQPGYHLAVVEDITKRKEVEKQLKNLNKTLDQRVETSTSNLKFKTKNLLRANVLLEEKDQNLEEMNTSLKVLIKQNAFNHLEIERNLLSSIKILTEPYLEKLNKICSNSKQKNLVEIIKNNLNEVVSPFSNQLSNELSNLTSTEIRVSDLIKNGHSNKEIADLIGVSPVTVCAHRRNIRKKLGITNTKKNLRTYLNSTP
jgi:PAS domain S-box-containing protein